MSRSVFRSAGNAVVPNSVADRSAVGASAVVSTGAGGGADVTANDLIEAKLRVDSSYLLPLADDAGAAVQKRRDDLLTAAVDTVLAIGIGQVERLVLMPDAAQTGYAADVQGAVFEVRADTPAAAVVGPTDVARDFYGVVMTYDLAVPLDEATARRVHQKTVEQSQRLEEKLAALDEALAREHPLRPLATKANRLSAVIGTVSTSFSVERHEAHDRHDDAVHWRLVVRTYDAAYARAARRLVKTKTATVGDLLKSQREALEASKRLARVLAAYLAVYLKLPSDALTVHRTSAAIGGAEAMNPTSVNVYNVFDAGRSSSNTVLYYRRAYSTQLASGAMQYGRTRALGHIAFPGAPWSSAQSLHGFPLGRARRFATRFPTLTVEDVEDAAAAQRVAFARRLGEQPFSTKLSSAAYEDLGDELQHAPLLDTLRRLGWSSPPARIWKTHAAYLSPWLLGRDIDRDEAAPLMKHYGVKYELRVRREVLLRILVENLDDGVLEAYGARVFVGEAEDASGEVVLNTDQVIRLRRFLAGRV
jgi:hypothetical protein